MFGTDRKQNEPEGLRARKYRQTRGRIFDAAFRLFLERGYDGTTLDAIAAVAEISRRSLFHYFDSKEAILQGMEQSHFDALRAAVVNASEGLSPLELVRGALLEVVGLYQTDQAIAIDRLLRSNDALRARKQANYERQERIVFSALCERWRAPERHGGLRMVAMMAIGAMRIAAERWGAAEACDPLANYLQEAFEQLEGEIGP